MRKIAFLFFICFISLPLLAAKEQYVNENSGSADPVIVQDQHYTLMGSGTSWTSQFTNYAVRNKVSIGYKQDQYPTVTETRSVSLYIEYWTHNGTAFVYNQTTKVLTINFNSSGSVVIDDASAFIFEGAYKIKVTPSSSIPTNMYLRTEIDIERYYTFSPTTSISTLNATLLGTGTQYIRFYWDPILGAEEYDLEWAFVPNPNNLTLAGSNLKFDFYKNATRVIIRDNFYEIPAIFNRGFIVYRVRPVGRRGTNFNIRKEGLWSGVESGMVESFAKRIQISTDYEVGKNWVHQISYSDHGKRFESIAYFDGINRARQSQAINPETEQVIVNNVYYDRIGRPSVTHLPTPVESDDLNHRPNFNLGSNGQPYGTQHFDFDQDPVTQTCPPTLPPTYPFSTTQGTGQYYSVNNPDKAGANAYIPNAAGHAFTQIEYMNDPTGRIRKSGGFGQQHQLTTHSNRYMYETPTPDELNRLFGTEVGYNSHYQKRITIDMNGQAYAEYFDMAGRVIASNLIGSNPTSLDAIDGNTGAAPVANTIMSNGSLNTIQNAEAIYTFTEAVVIAGDYQYQHTFRTKEFEDVCLPENFCYDCLYDLEFKITCGGVEVQTITKHINGWEINAACLGAHDETSSISVNLEKGEYFITKKLKVSDDAAQLYWCNYADNEICSDDFFTLYNQQYNQTQFGCNDPLPLDEYTSPCEIYRSMLAMDMSLGGQYGDISNLNSYGNPIDPLSIYNMSHSLPNGGNWRNPVGDYLNHDGSIATIPVTYSLGVYAPAVVSITQVFTAPNGQMYTHPENLANFSDFVANFQNAWADALVPYHPEFCYLQFCEENSAFHSYAEQLTSISTYNEACELGFFNPLQTGITPTSAATWNYYDGCDVNTDGDDKTFLDSKWKDEVGPWLENSYNIGLISDSITKFYVFPSSNRHVLSLWEYAIWQAHCPELIDYSKVIDCIQKAEPDPCTKDLVWQIFQNEYRQIRDYYYLIWQTTYVSYPSNLVGGGCGPAFNGCIGSNSYSPSTPLRHGIKPSQHVDGSTVTPISNTTGPCSNGTAALYQTKVPRFDNLPLQNDPAPIVITPNQQGVDDLNAFIEQQTIEFCSASCESYADDWMQSLEGCAMTPTQKTQVRNALIGVCINGCDADNPGGSSTISPSSTFTYDSFQDVLASILGSNYESAVCSELLLPDPKPYGQGIQTQDFNVLDNCGCDVLLQANYDLSTMSPLPVSVNSLEDMIYYNEGISLNDASAMLCACQKAIGYAEWTPSFTWNTTQINTILADEIKLPVSGLSCQSSEICYTCSQVQQAVGVFEDRFSDESNFENHDNYELLFTTFLNNELEINFTYEEYEIFLEHCNSANEPLGTITSFGGLFKELMNVVIKQGKLLTPSSLPENLEQSNIVYQYSNFHQFVPGKYYFSEWNSSQLVLKFGTTSNFKKATFDLPLDLDLSKVIGISEINAEAVCEGNNIRLKLDVIECGQIVNKYIYGHSSDLDIVKVYCESSQQLCFDPFAPQVTGAACFNPDLMVLNNSVVSAFQQQMANLKAQFIANYTAVCASAFNSETITAVTPENNYQYTLFFYDQSGNLTKTVAPDGYVNHSLHINYSAVESSKQNPSTVNKPNNNFQTIYKYNSYNQLVETTNPDQVGATKYWYDRYGRIVASQNPVQASSNLYAYILYDALGRPQQTGLTAFSSSTSLQLTANIDDQGVSYRNLVTSLARSEVTYTHYDEALNAIIPTKFESGLQEELRLRVAAVLKFTGLPPGSNPAVIDTFTSAIHYSYDQHGNVIEVLQDYPVFNYLALRYQSTQYEFELLSGNVKKVSYQKGKKDFYAHVYEYDLLNRLTEVYTTTNEVFYNREAHYYYFDYGPLARVEIGQQQVQGMDFAYTINGWIKGMNSSVISPNLDMGRDGLNACLNTANNYANLHQNFAKDVNAYTLGYYNNDYSPIGGRNMEAAYTSADMGQASELFNGNIRSLVTSIVGMQTMGSKYRYDQLNRLKQMEVMFEGTNMTNGTYSWSGAASSLDYRNTYTYDRNGNIKSLFRNGHGTNRAMDDLTYHYVTNTNRLNRVTESSSTMDVNFTEDIDYGQLANNYQYDNLGQILQDVKEGKTYVWTRADKKLKSITPSDGNFPLIEFVYNPFGQRIVKIEKTRVGGVVQTNKFTKTFYVYDANGQVMAMYRIQRDGANETAVLDEQYIYGASRVGIIEANLTIYNNGIVTPPATQIYVNQLGRKRFEITNYLGNVNAVITDRKLETKKFPTITDQVGISVSSGVIIKTGTSVGWNAGGASAEKIEKGGFVEWIMGGSNVNENYGTTSGLSLTNTNSAQNTIPYAWEVTTTGVARIVENGTVVGTFTSVALGTNLRIERDGCFIKYFMNGVLRRSVSDLLPEAPMIVDFSIDQLGKKIHNLRIQSSSRFEAVTKMSADYYPFGMEMPGRRNFTDEYRYGYNGMEKDLEHKTNGNAYTTEFRQYDPRLGRWMSLDPLMMKFPWMSPYVAFDNNPVFFVDPWGLESGTNKDGPKNESPCGSSGSDNNSEPSGNTLPTVEFKAELITKGNEEYRNWVKNELGREGILAIKKELYFKKRKKYDTNFGKSLNGGEGYNDGLPSDVIDKINEEVENEIVPTMKNIWAMMKSGYDPNKWNPMKRISFMYWKARAVTTRGQGLSIIKQVALEVAIDWALNFTLKTSTRSGGVSIKSGAAKGVPALRAAYVSEVEGLSSVASKMRAAGSSSEEIARTLHGLRRELGVKYKSLTPDNMLQQIYQRNLQKYGDKLGPSIDYLRQQGKSWDDIINSATRTGGKDLGF